MLIRNRASKSRLSGKWSDDDYGVFDGDHRTGAAHPDHLRLCGGRAPPSRRVQKIHPFSSRAKRGAAIAVGYSQ
jgi:hypothetical protein